MHDQHPARIDRVEDKWLVEIDAIELEECLACAGSRRNQQLHWRETSDHSICRVPSGSIEEPKAAPPAPARVPIPAMPATAAAVIMFRLVTAS